MQAKPTPFFRILALALSTPALFGPVATASDTRAVDVLPNFQLSQTGQDSGTAISDDGRYVAFSSTQSGLVAGVTGNVQRVYLRDMALGTTMLVSRTSTGSAPSTGDSNRPSMSGDGNYVVFQSNSPLLPNSPDPATAVYLFQRSTGQVEGIGIGTTGDPEWSVISTDGGRRVSGDGRYVVFDSQTSLVTPHTEPWVDVYVRDRVLQQTILLTPSTAGTTADSRSGSISSDGTRVLFKTLSTSLDGIPWPGLYVKNLQTGVATRIDVDAQGIAIVGALGASNLALSGDGEHAAIDASGANPAFGDPDFDADIYVIDIGTKTIGCASHGLSGQPSNGECRAPDLSIDGRYVVYHAGATNLVPWDVNNPFNGGDLILHDRATDRNALMNVSSSGGQGTNGTCSYASISGDGRFVAFVSTQLGLVSGDGAFTTDVFRRDRRGFANLGYGRPGIFGFPSLEGTGLATGSNFGAITLSSAAPNAPAVLMVSIDRSYLIPATGPLQGTNVVTASPILVLGFTTHPTFSTSFMFQTTPSYWYVPETYVQCAIADSAAAFGVAVTNALLIGL